MLLEGGGFLLRLRAGTAGLMLVAASAAHAGSFMRSEGELQYSGALSYTSASETWDAEGELGDLPCTTTHTAFSNSMEYAYSYYYNFYGGVRLIQAQCGDRKRTGLGDLSAGVRGRIFEDRNYRTWEAQVTIPVSGSQAGNARLGCGAFGAGFDVAASEPSILPGLSIGGSAGVRLWEAPLAHTFQAGGYGTGPIGALNSRWSWYADLTGQVPVIDREIDPGAAASDCGTQAKALRSSAELKYALNRFSSVGCGVGGALMGEDVSRTRGAFCGFSRFWR